MIYLAIPLMAVAESSAGEIGEVAGVLFKLDTDLGGSDRFGRLKTHLKYFRSLLRQ